MAAAAAVVSSSLAAKQSSSSSSSRTFMAPASQIKAPAAPRRLQKSAILGFGRRNVISMRGFAVVAMATATAPAKERMAGLVEESIKKAEEACAGDETSGECAAAWDEVEEVSAAASDLRKKETSSDPLDDYCKDNPESDECRTYDN